MEYSFATGVDGPEIKQLLIECDLLHEDITEDHLQHFLLGRDGPKLAAVVVIDEPHGELYYGSDVAAPVFADVMAESLRLLAIPPDAMPTRDPGSVMQAMSQ